MNLAERIMQLRTARGLSQTELAEHLGVSRQSVSKWETGGSVPDLDKLVALSDLFGITLDELVRGDATPAAVEEENPYLRQNAASVAAAAEQGSDVPSVQRTIGYICLAVGLMTLVLGLLFGGLLAILGAYVAVCGGILIFVRRYAWLPILFITLVPLMLTGPMVLRFTVYWQIFNAICLLVLFVAVVHFIKKKR